VETGQVPELIARAEPEPLTLPVRSLDHPDHFLRLALMGYPQLAADHLLHPEASDHLPLYVSSLVRRAARLVGEGLKPGEAGFEARAVARARLYEALLELSLNLMGVERAWARVEGQRAASALSAVREALAWWEELERRELGRPLVLEAVVERLLRSAELVNRGRSMVAQMAREIRRQLDGGRLASSFLGAAERVLAGNFYRRAYEAGLCRFGNDYALGLRWLRHLGFVQVSTNPVLAARAYDDDPSLWERFGRYAREVLMREHPEWFRDPQAHADDLAMEATRFALMDNFIVFRLPFIVSGYRDGLVSYQLNPLIAHDAARSVEAARVFVERLERDLAVYDEYLWWGYGVPEKGRANVVIKVAAAYPAALEIVERINEMGIGQNVTLSYTVSQEVLLGVAAMRGMARAVKRGIIPTLTYDTNMGGRLEDHLREVAAARLLLEALEGLGEEDRWRILGRLAEGLGVSGDRWEELRGRGLRAAVEALCSAGVLGRDLRRGAFVEALVEALGPGRRGEVERRVGELEEAIRLAGTFVAKRVYEILFSPWNREKWVRYLMEEEGLTREQAELVLSRIDLLPASKRKPADTLLTLSSKNVTNTEFPDHQLNVAEACASCDLSSLRESISQPLDGRHLGLLMELEDFVRAYEASPEVNELLRRAGVAGDYGSRGVSPRDWPTYGPCVKTLDEFTRAYLAFRARVVELARSIGGSTR